MISTRIIFFLGMTLAALFFPFWTFVLLAFVYAFFFTAYELLVLAVLIDAEFGDPQLGAWYMYTAVVAIILVFTTYAKPYLRFYR